MEGEIFLPEIHPHALNLKSSNKLYECRGCEVVGSDLRRLRCEQCDFDFHEECAHVKRTTTHDLYNKYNFKFFHQPPHPSSTKRCVVCRGFVPGFVYYCEELELCMHPRCHSLQTPMSMLSFKSSSHSYSGQAPKQSNSQTWSMKSRKLPSCQYSCVLQSVTDLAEVAQQMTVIGHHHHDSRNTPLV